tara:strand:- start:2570 stop:2842 length:273 start_codon:yes stop_codon:yes gene_type:complete
MEDLKLFHILTNSDQQLDIEVTPMLINLEHVITIKPINIMMSEKLVEGYWIRMSNGKKYRASNAPGEIKELLYGNRVVKKSSESEDSVVH